MLVLKMAWRNVWRNSRRSSITIAAMTLALVVELLYSGLVGGLVYGMEDDATAFELGDVQVFVDGYLTKPSLYDAVPNHEVILDKLDQVGYRSTARLFSGGLAAAGELSAGVSFVGIDPVRDAQTLDLHEAMAQGEWLSNDVPNGVVIGRGLARTLALELGDEIIVLSGASDGSTANDLVFVRGILMSVAAGLDRSAILMTEDYFRELLVFEEGAHKIFVRKPRDVELNDAAAVVRGIVDEVQADAAPAALTPVDVMTWKQVSPFLAQYIDSVSGVILIVYFIVYVAVAILILNAMLMAVFERIREFGVLKAIGYGPFQVMSMMLMEGMVQASVATVIGFALAAPGMWYLQVHGVNVGSIGGMEMAGMTMPPIWNGHYTFEVVRVPVIMLFVIVFFAVLYPAIKAARLKPVDAIHHQ